MDTVVKEEIDETKDVKIEEDDEYQHVIPYEYRDYMGQSDEKSRHGTSSRCRVKCQCCQKVMILEGSQSLKDHAATHTHLKRFECGAEDCYVRSWRRGNIQKHARTQHRDKTYSVKEIKLTEEEEIELRNMAVRCFPGFPKEVRVEEEYAYQKEQQPMTSRWRLSRDEVEGNNNGIDVKIEEDDLYQDVIPQEYQDDKEPKFKKRPVQCQKCKDIVNLNGQTTAEDHAAMHANLKRFLCSVESCNFGGWQSRTVHRHAILNHFSKDTVRKKGLTEEEKIKLGNMIVRCFPGLDELETQKCIINDEEMKIEEDSPHIPFEYHEYKEPAIGEGESGEEKCQKCRKMVHLDCFATAENHAASHTNLKRFACTQCNYKAWNREDVIKHAACITHKRTLCSVVEISLTSQEEYERRNMVKECFPGYPSSGKEVKPQNSRKRPATKLIVYCRVCGKMMMPNSMENHAACHVNLYRFQCLVNGCAFKCWSVQSATYHVDIVHKMAQLTMKDVVRRELSLEEELELERMVIECFPMNEAHSGFRKCHKCHSNVSNRSIDAENHASTHTELAERFECPIEGCDVRSYYDKYMLDHVRTSHSICQFRMMERKLTTEELKQFEVAMGECFPGVTIGGAKKVAPGERKYNCHICQVTIIETSSSNPRASRYNHALFHTDLSLYKCIVPGCRFTANTPEAMTRHEKEVHRINTNMERTQVEVKKEQNKNIEQMFASCFPGSEDYN